MGVADGFKIADTFIDIHADTRNLNRDVQGAVRDVDVDRESDRLGRRMGSGIGRGLVASLGGGGGGGGIIGTTLGVMATKFAVATVAAAGLIGVAQELTGVLGLLPAVGFVGGLAVGTLAVATDGFGDAMKNVGDPEKFAESIGALSPNARSAATALRDLLPAWAELKSAVQDRFFDGLGGMFTDLAGRYLPMLQSSMSSVASSMNGMIRGVGAEFAEAGRQADMRLILDASVGSLRNLLDAVRPLVSVFMDVAAVGAPILEDLTSKAGGLATKFADFIAKARETGQLGEWIQTGLQAFRDLWTIGELLFGTITNLVAALGGPDTLLGVLTLVAEALNAVSGFIRDNIEWLGPLATAVGAVVAVVKIWNTVQAAVNALLMVNPYVAIAVATLAIVLLIVQNWDKIKAFLSATWDWIKNNVSVEWAAIKSNISNFMAGIKNNVTTEWDAIKAHVGGAASGIKNNVTTEWDAIKSNVGSAGSWIKTNVSTEWNAIKANISSIVSGIKGILNWFGSLPGLFSGWFNSAKNAASTALGSLVSFVAGIPGRIAGALGSLGGLLTGAGHSLIMGLWNGIQSAFNWVKARVSGMMASLRNLFPFSPAKEGPFSGTGYTSFSGAAMIKDWAKGMTSQAGAVRSAVEGIMGDLQPRLALDASVGGSAGSGGQAMPVAAAASHSTTIANLTLQVAGNLDPTNPTAYRQAIENLIGAVRDVERSYA